VSQRMITQEILQRSKSSRTKQRLSYFKSGDTLIAGFIDKVPVTLKELRNKMVQERKM